MYRNSKLAKRKQKQQVVKAVLSILGAVCVLGVVAAFTAHKMGVL